MSVESPFDPTLIHDDPERFNSEKRHAQLVAEKQDSDHARDRGDGQNRRHSHSGQGHHSRKDPWAVDGLLRGRKDETRYHSKLVQEAVEDHMTGQQLDKSAPGTNSSPSNNHPPLRKTQRASISRPPIQRKRPTLSLQDAAEEAQAAKNESAFSHHGNRKDRRGKEY